MLPPSFFTGKLPMIHCLLIQITQNSRGQTERQEREISSDRLTLGRGADCKIHLADHRVALHHASIQQGDDDKLYISAEPSRTIEVDGHLEEVATLTIGMRIMIGPYALRVEALEGNEHITLSYELMNNLPDTIQPKLATSLFATGLSMRKPAMWFAAIITLIFVVLPISYTLNPWLHKTAQSIHLPMNVPLNAGHMSPGHLALSTKCDTCHQKPFMAVSDQACENCHKSVSHHIAQSALHAKVFKNVRCTTCHMDHRGQKGLIRKDSQQCVSCHGNIKKIYGESKLKDIHDFSSDHPAFKLSFKAGPDGLTTRVAQNEKSKL
ncbi:MAG: cytochrome c3 family protein, partial [Methylophilaceae bacterium]